MDKKNILNKYILKTQIRERLEYRKECLEYIAIQLKHIEINDRVGKEFYQKKPIIYFILKLYFMPLNLYRFFSKLQMVHHYNKCLKEIEILNLENRANENEKH